ncbi:hypothetical protein SADUNF_Sadunf09G0059100 [Salix dunnii]|uniref:Uncharacterized protein n=1 Tax=Salix dunnii TaxID=1413687 RepID=A0A835MT62_9ROSI|nr:hypothetical protein SADUNF_Sadunf09G0059100 [Salix dunnii]
MKTTWISPKPQISSSPAAMVTTYTPQQQGEPLYVHDKHFGLHGEVLMIVVVGIFFIFLVSLLLFPCLKRRRTPDSEDDSDSTMQGSLSFLSLRKRRRIDT